MAGQVKPGHDEVSAFAPAIVPLRYYLEKFFIIFVDQIFTTSLQHAFTKAFDASAQSAAIACVYRAGNAD